MRNQKSDEYIIFVYMQIYTILLIIPVRVYKPRATHNAPGIGGAERGGPRDVEMALGVNLGDFGGDMPTISAKGSKSSLR